VNACIICGKDARHTIGIRSRYGRQKNADWAPETGAYLCDKCAQAGVEIAIAIGPTSDRRVTTHTTGPAGRVSRAVEIGTGRKLSVGQGTLGL